MKKKYTLKGRKGVFRRVMRGTVIKKGGLTIFMTAGHGKIGVTCSKTVKGAVNRNRIKRHLREYARKYILPQIANRNVVLIASSHLFLKKKVNLGEYEGST